MDIRLIEIGILWLKEYIHTKLNKTVRKVKRMFYSLSTFKILG